jgi:hypothetical protein
MNQITFLFGAGASKNALPLVNEMPERIQNLIKFLERDDMQIDENSTFDKLGINGLKSKRFYQAQLIENLRWAFIESQNHASADTFAKKLFIKERYTDLKKLKIAMSVFFIFEQALNKPDKRYDAFFAALLNSVTDFPKNVKILTWNYDYQFELAFSEYIDKPEIDSNQSFLKIGFKHDMNRGYIDNFNIYKLNGTTSLYSPQQMRNYLYVPNLKVPVDKNFITQVVQNYVAATYIETIGSSLSFAWERERAEKGILELAIENITETVALVIIGYSFPFFNRDADRKIIGSMKNLQKVYLQAPDADVLKERFQAIRDDITGIELISKFDVGQFLLPNEL